MRRCFCDLWRHVCNRTNVVTLRHTFIEGIRDRIIRNAVTKARGYVRGKTLPPFAFFAGTFDGFGNVWFSGLAIGKARCIPVLRRRRRRKGGRRGMEALGLEHWLRIIHCVVVNVVQFSQLPGEIIQCGRVIFIFHALLQSRRTLSPAKNLLGFYSDE